MHTGKWDPLHSIEERVNRLFEDAFRGGPDEENPSGVWSPAVDIYDTESGFVVKADLPEVGRPDIEIKVEGNTLAIRGERKLKDGAMENYHRIERGHGSFSRSFLLPQTVDVENIEASFKDGILKIVLPKKRDILPKQIEIK